MVIALGLSISTVACTSHGLVGIPQRDAGSTGGSALEDAGGGIPGADVLVQPDQAMSTGDIAAERGLDAAATLETGGVSDTRGVDVGGAVEAGRDTAPDTVDAPRIEAGGTFDTRRDIGSVVEAGRDAIDTVVSVIALGHSSSCAVVNGGVQCWGWNEFGQLGNGTTKDSPVPVQVQGLTSGVTALAVGLGYACAVVNGGVQCWGLNNEGQLGNGSTNDSRTPVQVEALTSGVTAIAATAVQIGSSDQHVCAVVNGGVQCWGNNRYGKLGNASTTSSNVPVQVQGLTSGATAVTVGEIHSCAIVKGGAQCWGWNGDGQLGNGTNNASSVPVQVQGLTSGVTSLSAGAGVTCAVVDGVVQCWGGNAMYSTLGTSTTIKSNVPVRADDLDSGATAVSAGYIYGCAIIGGGVLCWGDWSTLLSSNSGTTGRAFPKQVPGITSGATVIATGHGHSCAVVKGGVQCWGDNFRGELGNNSTSDSLVPVRVQFP